jgi:two-component system nitrogen regulation sensor histidine kinase NtrY
MGKQNTISKQVTIPTQDTKLTLQVNLSLLKDENDEFMGTVVVFDDLSHLVKAQRMAAWREVARRIAHETRTSHPYSAFGPGPESYLTRFNEKFRRMYRNDYQSVDELKTLVDEFSNLPECLHPACRQQP